MRPSSNHRAQRLPNGDDVGSVGDDDDDDNDGDNDNEHHVLKRILLTLLGKRIVIMTCASIRVRSKKWLNVSVKTNIVFI